MSPLRSRRSLFPPCESDRSPAKNPIQAATGWFSQLASRAMAVRNTNNKSANQASSRLKLYPAAMRTALIASPIEPAR